MNNSDVMLKDGSRVQFSVQQIMSCNEKKLGLHQQSCSLQLVCTPI